MKVLTNLLSSLMIAAWVGAIAIFSIQNIQPVSLKFITFESIKLPLGVLLSLCVGAGMISGSLLPLLFSRRKRSARP